MARSSLRPRRIPRPKCRLIRYAGWPERGRIESTSRPVVTRTPTTGRLVSPTEPRVTTKWPLHFGPAPIHWVEPNSFRTTPSCSGLAQITYRPASAMRRQRQVDDRGGRGGGSRRSGRGAGRRRASPCGAAEAAHRVPVDAPEPAVRPTEPKQTDCVRRLRHSLGRRSSLLTRGRSLQPIGPS